MDPREANIDQLLDCTNADNAVERIQYRKEVASNGRRDFIRLDKGEKGQSSTEKTQSVNASKTVSFRHLKYQVSESNGHVSIFIEKKVSKEVSFYVKTTDDTAKAGEDYEAIDMLVIMQPKETEREIKIGIVDDPDWEPDEEFKVTLLEPETKKRLDGDDTECTVLILDEDKPGTIGFEETIVEVRRKDRTAYIKVNRFNGSDGRVSCLVNTDNNVDSLPGKTAGIENKDFVPIKDKFLEF